MNKKSIDRRRRFILTLYYSIAVFTVLLITMAIVSAVILLLIKQNILIVGDDMPSINRVFIIFIIASILLGWGLSVLTGRFPIKPLNRLIQAMNALASGDYSVRIKPRGMFSKLKPGKEVVRSFNEMAEALEKTETMTNEFVNRYSHEFKTPIASISGFAELLKRNDLTESQKAEYLDIIIQESNRLSRMATNILKLSKYESLTILTEQSEYNLSEQLRRCLLMTEEKWTEKHIELNLDLGEYNCFANSDMLAEVWLNIIDNAVKFCPDGGLIDISVGSRENQIVVRIANTGPMIPKDDISHIFERFYQTGSSVKPDGNGIGLAIVQEIIRLHHGQVTVESDSEITAFTVLLPGISAKV